MSIAQTIKNMFKRKPVEPHHGTLRSFQQTAREATAALLTSVEGEISFKFAQTPCKPCLEYLHTVFPYGDKEINMSPQEYGEKCLAPGIASLIEKLKEKKRREIVTYDLDFIRSVNYQHLNKISGLSAFFYIDMYKDEPQIVMTVAI